jgi:hypothetical protein
MEDIKYCFVQFKCNYTTNYGEELRVVGNIPELGNSKLKKAIGNQRKVKEWLHLQYHFLRGKRKNASKCVKNL